MVSLHSIIKSRVLVLSPGSLYIISSARIGSYELAVSPRLLPRTGWHLTAHFMRERPLAAYVHELRAPGLPNLSFGHQPETGRSFKGPECRQLVSRRRSVSRRKSKATSLSHETVAPNLVHPFQYHSVRNGFYMAVTPSIWYSSWSNPIAGVVAVCVCAAGRRLSIGDRPGAEEVHRISTIFSPHPKLLSVKIKAKDSAVYDFSTSKKESRLVQYLKSR